MITSYIDRPGAMPAIESVWRTGSEFLANCVETESPALFFHPVPDDDEFPSEAQPGTIEHLQVELARSNRYEYECCVLFLDIDSFKQVNDRFGHATGNEVLRSIAGLFEYNGEGLRSSDLAARYGGDEFCVVLPQTPLDGGRTKAERIRRAIEEFNWRNRAPQIDEKVTVSVGVAAFPWHGDASDSLIAAADAAQYRAKRAGKNQVFVAD